jgi:hypothetical protein
MEEFFEIAGQEYYFDLDNISSYIRIDDELSVDFILNKEAETTEGELETPNLQMIDVSKWEIIKVLIETTLNENGIIDESMGIKKLESQLSIPFRLSFNTLIKHKLIKKNG